MSSSYRGSVGTGQGYAQNTEYKRIIPAARAGEGISIPEIPSGQETGGKLLFRLTKPDEKDIRHGVQFWVDTGKIKEATGKTILLPYVSDRPFSEFAQSSATTGKIYISYRNPECILACMAQQGSPVIAAEVNKKDGKRKAKMGHFHTAQVQLIKAIRGADGKPLRDVAGQVQIEVSDEVYGFQFRQNWWGKLVDLLDPQPDSEVKTEDDGLGASATPKESKPTLKQFMEKNKIQSFDQIVFYIQKVVRKENPVSDPMMNVNYNIGFLDSTWIKTPGGFQPKEALVDFDKVYKTITSAELAEFETNHGITRHSSVAGGAKPAPEASSIQAPPANPQAPGYFGQHSAPLAGGHDQSRSPDTGAGEDW